MAHEERPELTSGSKFEERVFRSGVLIAVSAIHIAIKQSLQSQRSLALAILTNAAGDSDAMLVHLKEMSEHLSDADKYLEKMDAAVSGLFNEGR